MRELASKGQLRFAYFRWAIVTVPLILLLGFASGRMAPSGDENLWFAALDKPPIMPPGWAFPVAWSILYILMGLALALVLNARGSRKRRPALILFVAQLLLNLAWTPVFFGMHQVVPALVIIAALVVLIALTIWLFWQVRRTAGLLLLPYLAWICFAFVLLYQIHDLNPDAQSLVPSRTIDQIEIR
ncbi:tryptophan-rich sensory protein [Sphingomonas sp. IC-56]|uniref:TspO/MBR family protein n=1 Tax=Sphingomonas sp. IC-56 TaxID=2898529 RepID=UPI001E647264|nr:TspO/MBR family protein [Sphingomonas sp. IC-56]MCD2324134.1 tryptophan-rich sensory protein [Sphingomonas sp. IC-56]